MLGLHRIYWAGVLGLGLLVGLLALDRQFPPPLDAALQDVSTVVRDREGRVLRAFPVAEGRWRLAADLDSIDPDFIEALLAYEDSRFYSHAGVDPLYSWSARAGGNGNPPPPLAVGVLGQRGFRGGAPPQGIFMSCRKQRHHLTTQQ